MIVEPAVENTTNAAVDQHDLLSLVLSLKPVIKDGEDHPLPAWWGRAVHAMLLRVVNEQDAGLAERLHADNQVRPFTTSNLTGHFPNRRLDAEQTYRLRLTAVNHDVTTCIMKALNEGRSLGVGACVELDGFKFEIVNHSLQPQDAGWASMSDYQALAMQHLTNDRAPSRRVRLQFKSPTTFKSDGKMISLPLPELVFGSLLERWNHFAPLDFAADLRRYAAECLVMERYQLKTRPVQTNGGGLRIGSLGEVTYLSLNYDRYWMSLIRTLGAYALYAGTGAGTAMGLGQCRMLERVYSGSGTGKQEKDRT